MILKSKPRVSRNVCCYTVFSEELKVKLIMAPIAEGESLSKKACIALLSIIAGFSAVVQQGTNISLSNWLQYPLRSAFFNFLIGAIVVMPYFAVSGNRSNSKSTLISPSDANTHVIPSFSGMFRNLFASLKEDKRNWFVLLNGCIACIIVSTPIFIIPEIGFALYTISVLFGRILGSILMDNYGLIWTEIKEVTTFKLLGALFVFLGVVSSQIPSFEDNDSYDLGLTITYMIIVMFNGMLTIINAALHRRMTVMIKGSPYQSVFLIGMNASLVLILINIVVYISMDDWFETNNNFAEWYMFFGGFCGAYYTLMIIISPGYIGFVATFICLIFGELLLSVIFDYINAFGISHQNELIHESVWKLLGIILVFIGAVLANIYIPNKNKEGYSIANSIEDIIELNSDDLKATKHTEYNSFGISN